MAAKRRNWHATHTAQLTFGQRIASPLQRQWTRGPSSSPILRIIVTGEPSVRGGGGMPQRISTISRRVSVLRITGAG
jgi:hypothetical protein